MGEDEIIGGLDRRPRTGIFFIAAPFDGARSWRFRIRRTGADRRNRAASAPSHRPTARPPRRSIAAAIGKSIAARNGAAASAAQRRRGTNTASATAPAARMPAPTASRDQIRSLCFLSHFLSLICFGHIWRRTPCLSLAIAASFPTRVFASMMQILPQVFGAGRRSPRGRTVRPHGMTKHSHHRRRAGRLGSGLAGGRGGRGRGAA